MSKTLLFLLLYYFSYSQFVVSSEDNFPIKFVVIKTDKLVSISDSTGYFNLEFSDTDSVYFRHIAYYDTVIIGKELKRLNTIIMRPKNFLADAVLITTYKDNFTTIGNDACSRLVGNAFIGKCCEWQYFPNPLGMETKIKSLLFKVAGGNSKCVLTVNLYEVINGDSFNVAKPLLPEDVKYYLKGLNIFFPVSKMVEIDVSEYNITLPATGIFVKVCGKCRDGGKFYFKQTAVENKIPMYISCNERKISKYNLLPVKNLCCKGSNDVCYIVKAIRMKVSSP